MPGPRQKSKKKAKPSVSGPSTSTGYIPSNEFLDNVYHAEGWSAQADVLCTMLELPDMSSRSGLRIIHRNFDAVSRKLNDVYDYGRRVGNESLIGTVVAMYTKMSADAVLRDRIFSEADFLQKVMLILSKPTCYHVGLHALGSFTVHGGETVRVEIAKKTPMLLQLLAEHPDDMKAAELTITTISHAVAAVVCNEMPPDAKLLKPVDIPRMLRVIIELIRRPLFLTLPTTLLFDHALSIISGATQHCHEAFQAYPAAIDFLVACSRSDDITTRAAGIAGILRLHMSDSEADALIPDSAKIMAAIQRGWPKHLKERLQEGNPSDGEIFRMMRGMKDYQNAMLQVARDHDMYSLGLKIAELIPRSEYAILDGGFQAPDPRTGELTVQNIGLPFTMWHDALPLCANAIRARGRPDEMDKADMVDLKYLILKSKVAPAVVIARKAIQRNPHVGFYYYVLILGADLSEGLRLAKKGLKCPHLTPYVRFALLIHAAEYAADLALRSLQDASGGGKGLQEGVAFAMSALEDSQTFIDEAPPDCNKMRNAIYVNVLMSLLIKGHELSDDMRELLDAKKRLDIVDDFARFFSRPLSRTQMRLACMELVTRMQKAWKDWDKIIRDHADVRSEISPAKAEDDLASWLEQIDIEDPGVCGHDHRHRDANTTHISLEINDVELNRCSWCRNPSVVLKKCSGCGKTKYCDSTCQKEHWKTHRKVCKKESIGH
ncbi:hypothetical protein DENSPDRAFT_808815 [Dentipellis sp. KUC8613]|nr:hypothetical protein DENSPDRAFT_808815 [Dentipellis sp. KUC8613]